MAEGTRPQWDVQLSGVEEGPMLVWTLAALFCTFVGVVLATLFVVVALWDTHRLLALGIPAILFLVGAALASLIVLGKARSKPRLFAASLAELSKDHNELISRL